MIVKVKRDPMKHGVVKLLVMLAFMAGCTGQDSHGEIFAINKFSVSYDDGNMEATIVKNDKIILESIGVDARPSYFRAIDRCEFGLVSISSYKPANSVDHTPSENLFIGKKLKGIGTPTDESTYTTFTFLSYGSADMEYVWDAVAHEIRDQPGFRSLQLLEALSKSGDYVVIGQFDQPLETDLSATISYLEENRAKSTEVSSCNYVRLR